MALFNSNLNLNLTNRFLSQKIKKEMEEIQKERAEAKEPVIGKNKPLEAKIIPQKELVLPKDDLLLSYNNINLNKKPLTDIVIDKNILDSSKNLTETVIEKTKENIETNKEENTVTEDNSTLDNQTIKTPENPFGFNIPTVVDKVVDIPEFESSSDGSKANNNENTLDVQNEDIKSETDVSKDSTIENEVDFELTLEDTPSLPKDLSTNNRPSSVIIREDSTKTQSNNPIKDTPNSAQIKLLNDMKESIKENSFCFYPNILIDTYYDKAFEESLKTLETMELSQLNPDDIEKQFENILKENLTYLKTDNSEELKNSLTALLNNSKNSLTYNSDDDYTKEPLLSVYNDSIDTIVNLYCEDSSCNLEEALYSFDNLVSNNTNDYYLSQNFDLSNDGTPSLGSRTVANNNDNNNLPAPTIETFINGEYTIEFIDYSYVTEDGRLLTTNQKDKGPSGAYATVIMKVTNEKGVEREINITMHNKQTKEDLSKLKTAISQLRQNVFEDLINEVETIISTPNLMKNAAGSYLQGFKAIRIDTLVDASAVLTHEIGHAIDNKDRYEMQTSTLENDMMYLIRTYGSELKSMYSKVKKSFDNRTKFYALTNYYELYAEYYTYKSIGYTTNSAENLFQFLEKVAKKDKRIEQLLSSLDKITKDTRTKTFTERIGLKDDVSTENPKENKPSSPDKTDKPSTPNTPSLPCPEPNYPTQNPTNDWDMPSTPDTPSTPSTPNNATPNLPDINLPDMSDLGFDVPDFSGYGSGETNVTEKTDTYTKTGNISEFDNNSFNPEGADADLPSNATSILQAQAEAAAEAAAAKARQEYGDDAQITTSTNITIDENGNYSVEVSITVKDVETTKGDNSTNNDGNTNGTNGSNQGQGGNGLGGNGLGSNYGAGSGNNASSTSSSDWMLDSIPSSGSSSSGSGNSGNNTNTTGTNNYDIDAGWMDELVITPDNTNNNGHTNSNSSDLTGLTNGNPYDNLVIQTPGHDFGEMYIESEWTSLFDDYDTSWDNYLSDYSSMWGGGGGSGLFGVPEKEEGVCQVCGALGAMGGKCQMCGNNDWKPRYDW